MASNKHNNLKYKAIEWLKGQDFTDIEIEVRILNHQTGNAWRGSFVIDIVGRKEHRKMAIECGGSRLDKLNKIASEFNEIYILPYGEDVPYKWERDIDICKQCGHIV